MAANPNPSRITAASWWLMEQLQALQPGSRNGGIYANKPGYHNTRAANSANDYSVREPEDKGGPGDKAAAYDWTFPDAQRGSYQTISRYSGRLLASGRDRNDPRLNGWREFFGQTDTDDDVEGWNFRHDRTTRSDRSHLWHIHLSEDRDKVTSMDNKRKLLSVLRGETVEQWRRVAPAAQSVPVRAEDLHVLTRRGGGIGHTDRTSAGVWRQSWGSVFGAAGADLEAVTDLAAAGAGRQLHVLAVHNGKVSHTVRSPERAWTGWRDTGAPPATTRITAAVVAGDLHVLALHQGRLAHTVRRGGTGEWTDVFPATGTGLSAVTDLTAAGTGDQLQVLVLHDGRIAHTTRRADGSWSGWLDVFTDGGTGTLPDTTRLSAATVGSDLHLVTLHEGRLGHTDRRTSDGVWRQSWGSVFGAAGAELKAVTDVAAVGTGGRLQVLALHNGRLAHTVRSPERAWTRWLDVFTDGGTGTLPGLAGVAGASVESPGRP
jgi:hypothetical protein